METLLALVVAAVAVTILAIVVYQPFIKLYERWENRQASRALDKRWGKNWDKKDRS